jgi:hypothetical protein
MIIKNGEEYIMGLKNKTEFPLNNDEVVEISRKDNDCNLYLLLNSF